MNSKLDVKNGFFNLIIKQFARSKKSKKKQRPKDEEQSSTQLCT
jgi:hypothetical protein